MSFFRPFCSHHLPDTTAVDKFFEMLSARFRGKRKNLKENLKNELEESVKLLDGKGQLLPTKMYSSAASSGDLEILSFEMRKRLATIYFDIDNHNHEAKRVRDSAVVVNTGDGMALAGGITFSKVNWKHLSKRLIRREATLKQKISLLLRDKMWN